MKKSYNVTGVEVFDKSERKTKIRGKLGRQSYEDALKLTGNGTYNYLVLAACSITSHAVALDLFAFGVIVAASSCDLQLNMQQKGFLSSVPFAGILFACPWGYFADVAGRRRAIIWSTSVGFLFAALSSLATRWYIMLLFKFIGCSFSAASFSICMTMLGECVGPKRRVTYLQILNSVNLISEAVSFLLALYILPLDFNIPLPWIGISYRPWRLLTFILAVPLGLSAIMVASLHESPKFLASLGQEEKALQVLEDIYERNGGVKGGYMVKSLILEPGRSMEKETVCSSFRNQIVPIFRAPLLKRTLQLSYLLIIMCSTNNVFVMWFPTMVNSFSASLSNTNTQPMSFCRRINDNVTSIASNYDTQCHNEISSFTMYCGIGYGVFYFLLNYLVSYVSKHRRLIILAVFTVSAISCLLVELVEEPVANMIFFVLLQCTSILFGITGSYFVDMFPTKNSALASSLGMMLGRIGTFVGINLLGAVINSHCSTVFYSWTAFVLSGIGVTLFLPSDNKILDIGKR